MNERFKTKSRSGLSFIEIAMSPEIKIVRFFLYVYYCNRDVINFIFKTGDNFIPLLSPIVYNCVF